MNFKVITGYPDYLISESGEIFSLKSNRNLKPYKTTKGRKTTNSYGREGFI